MQTTSDWIEIAEMIWGLCKDKREAQATPLLETQILDVVRDNAQNALTSDDNEQAFLLGALTVPTDGQLTTTNLYRWAEGGYPTIEIGEKFAASLLVSSVSDEVLNTVKMPWPGISIIVPGDLLQVYEPAKQAYIPIRRIFASVSLERRHVPDKAFGGNWQFIAMATESLALWRFGVTPHGMVLESKEMLADAPKEGRFELEMEHTDVDSRTAGLIGKLVVMTCVAMTMKELVTEQSRPKPKSKKKRDAKEGPSARLYTVGKPIQLDFRDRVRHYLHGTRQGKSLNVQFMVAGHFKQQPFGDKSAQRKTIWVEPYWKGDEAAPVPLRTHTIKDGTTQA